MKKLASLLIAVLWITPVYGACTGSSPSWTSTPDEASMTTCISGLSANDTLTVTAGDGDETWTAIMDLPASGVKIIGPGSSNLIIRWSGAVSAGTTAAFRATDKNDWRISGFKFVSSGTPTYEVAVWVSGCTGWRIDNNYFDGAASTTSHLLYPAWITGNSTHPNVNGVIDSNTISNGRILAGNSSINTQAGWGGLWYTDYPLGNDGSGNAVYIEDNIVSRGDAITPYNFDSNRGARMVYRYNTFTNMSVMAHGWQDYGRGTRSWEVYGNTFAKTCSDALNALHIRSGTGVIFYNTFSGAFAQDIHLTDDRSEYGGTYPNSENTLAVSKCDGDHVGDGNTDPNPETSYKDGWPCRDQIGRGKDATLWDTCQTGAGPAQASQPAYFWSIYRSSTPVTAGLATDSNVSYDSSVTGLVAAHIVADRDYYDYTASFDGTSGTGCGTLASRPATCTTGVGYWATAQSCSNLTGMVGASPTTAISGTLYKCTSTDTWTSYYTPYTYPHPLRAEVTAQNGRLSGGSISGGSIR